MKLGKGRIQTFAPVSWHHESILYMYIYILISFFRVHLYSVKSDADFLPGIDASHRLRFFISLFPLSLAQRIETCIR